MNCTQYGFNIQGDVNGKLAKSVDAVAGHDYTKAQVLAGYFGTEDFSRYIKQETGLDDYLSVNANTMRKLLGSFFVSRHNSITNTINKKNADTLNGFSSAKAKSIAKDHTANLIIETYYTEINKPKNERLTKDAIIREVSKVINTNFNSKVAVPLIKRLTVENNNKEALSIIEKASAINAQIKQLNAQRSSLVKQYNDSEVEADRIMLDTSIDAIAKELITRDSERYVLFSNLIAIAGNVREKNYSNLISRVRGNPNEWYRSVFNTSKLVNLVDEFNITLENDKLIERNYADENDVVNNDSDSVDEMSKSWEDSLYGSFDRHVGTKLKVYLNRLYQLSTPTPRGSNQYQFDDNNELGVPMTMGANFIIAQISNYATFNSVDDFINSVNRVSQINPALYGLSKMVNDMADREFANYIFSQLNNPKMAKTIVTISETDVTFDQSNKSADALTYMFYSLLNAVKSTYKNSFDTKDKDSIRKHIKFVNDVNDVNVFNNGPGIKTIDKFIVDSLNKYFPNIDKKSITDYLHSNPSNSINIYEEFLKDLSVLMNSVENVVDDYNEKWGNYINEYGNWAKKRQIANEIGEVFSTAMPIFDYSSIDYNKMNAPLINISKKLVNYTAVKNELNSINAEGNMSSDLIGNSYLTNFVKQLQFSTPQEAEAGLERLKEFVTKSPQYQYSPFYFGVKDDKGRVIQEGLFNRDYTGKVTVNPNARNMINISLFDGAKDRLNSKATMYSGMSKGDYFITQLIAFKNPIDYVTQQGTGITTAGYFMRTPSDAPKNFIVQAPKYETDSLWRVVNASRDKYIQDIQDELFDKYSFTREGVYADQSEDVIIGNIRGKIDNNIMTANEIYDILKNPIDNKAYNNLYHIYDNDSNKVSIPIIYRKGESNIIVWLEGDKVVGTINNIAENLEVKEVYNSDGTILSYDFIIDIGDTLTQDGINSGRIERVVDKNNPAFRALHAHALGEVNNFVNNLNNVFEKKAGKWTSKTNTENLIDRAHYNNNEIVDSRKEIDDKPNPNYQKLTGNFFNFIRLFETNGYKAGDDLMTGLFLYGGVNAVGSDKVSFALSEIANNAINWDGNMMSPRPVLGIEWSDIRKGKQDLLDGKYTTAAAKRLVDAIDKAKQQGGYDFIEGSGGITNKTFVPINNSEPLLSSSKKGKLTINPNRTDLINTKNGKIEFAISNDNLQLIDSVVENWLNNYYSEVIDRTAQYNTIIGDSYSNNDIVDFAINNAIMEMNFDDVFEGDAKFYKGPQDFLKRAKEVQAAGKAYAGFNLNDSIGSPVHTVKDNNGLEIDIVVNGNVIAKARNGFKAVTIANTLRASQNAGQIKLELIDILTPKVGKTDANRIATEIGNGYFANTKVNDAQSYITLEEFIARKHADGTLNEYQDLLSQLMDDTTSIQDINLKGINARIQVQKNFYFDKQFDTNTGTFYPRQIKNAEFVLIPKLIKGTDLEQLYNVMKANGIDQVNTVEASKAAKKNILTFWDNNGVADIEGFTKAVKANNSIAIEDYYYQYLYKQQDVADHMVNENNKAGIQIMKKLIDNASPEVQPYIDSFFSNYVANIQDNFNMLLTRMGWKVENGNLVNANHRPNADGKDVLQFEDFYKKARVEAQRLGMDSNFIEYLTPDQFGQPSMPNYMNNVSSKLESIAQSIFNNGVTRQTLPGWHAAQVTSVGHGVPVLGEDGVFRDLKYHPQIKDENGNITQEAYAEVMLPRWSTLIPKDYDLSKLDSEGLDIHLGYRIPTEGKQSVSILKVVAFLDEVYGSTVMVPDEWVTQTGSDFDVDSIYGISYEMYKDKSGTIKKIQFDESLEDKDVQRRYVNYVNSTIEERVDKDIISDEFIKSEINTLRDSIKNNSVVQKESNYISEMQRQKAELYRQLPEENKTQVKRIDRSFVGDDVAARYDTVANFFNVLAENDTTDNKDLFQEFADYHIAIADSIRFSREINEENDADTFKSAKSALIKQIYEDARREHFNKVKSVAKKAGIVSYEEFTNWPIENQNSRRARNNKILDSMINIMKHPNSREENYSRSNFDDLTNAMKKMNNLRGASSIVRSTYNPLDQIDFMENAMSGATLKAFSVTRDTFNSVNNYTKSRLGEGHEIVVEYDLDDYNIKTITDSYDKVQVDKERNVAIVTHDRMANSNNNRNVVGKILTVYSSQTTAHILDAVKEGTIFNENKYTFGTFKTLIDVGIDYDTAIAFLMQPGVTKIVDSYFETKSIYINAGSNAINSAIKSIATDLGVTVGGKEVNPYTPIDLVIQQLSANPNIRNAYRQLFRANLSYANRIDNIMPALNGKMLQRRLNGVEITNNLELSEDQQRYQNAAFDLATIMNFNKYYKTTRNIEALARVSNPDRFGAKQTIRGTRMTLQNINKYSNDPTDTVGQTLMVGNSNIIQSLYPGIGSSKGIDVNNSSYPYLAAFLKFATQPSVEANSQLFPTESDAYNAITDTVQARLGINFTDDQYKEYKQYMISNVYSGVPFLTTPLTLNEYGLITYDGQAIERQTETNERYWDSERGRIFGYDVIQSSNIAMSDINNPTESDINNFNTLTPAQKVLWIQANFNDNKGVFDFLKVNMFNDREFKQKGFSSQSITYSDQIDDIEEVYIAFKDSFFNKNPLVRLATVDLIKYSFVVEGFRFKKGSISKIITNDTLYSNLEDKGMNLIEAIQQQFSVYNNPYDATTLRFIDKFIRSHSEIVTEVSIPKAKKDKQGNENIGYKFNRQTQGENIIYVPFEDATKELLEHLTITENNPKGYIRINKYISEKQRRTTLYKVINNDKGVYLYPLNLLERNETTEYSANNRNNIYKASEYYQAVIDMSVDNGSPINELLKDNSTVDQINILKDQFTITAHKAKNVVESVENPNEIIRISQYGTITQQAEVNKLISDVLDYINSPVEESGNYGVIRNDNSFINSIVPLGASIIQNIPNGEDIVTVKISKHTTKNGLSKQFGYVLREDRRGDITQVKPEERKALQNSIDAKSKRPTLYKIERVTSEQEREAYEKLREQVENEAASQMNAVTNLIEDIDVDIVFNYTETDKVARNLINELTKRALSNEDKRASKFKKAMDIAGIDRVSDNSIHDNKKSIYANASRYYTERSHEILSNIDKFTGINGEQYSIDDPALYKHLTEYPEDYPLLVKLILDAKTFGGQFYDIFNLNLVGEDDVTTNSIVKIRNAINNVRTSSKLKNAANLIFNDYIANNYSTNPNVRHGLIDLQTTFGDTDWFDLTFSDVGELNHKQVQAVVKYVNIVLNEATKITAPKSIKTFNTQHDAIMNSQGEYNQNNIITKEGKFITPYSEKFLEDREKVASDFKIAKETFGVNSLEYHKAKLVRDRWRAKNIHQDIISTYYDANNDLLENVLKSAPKEYVQYMDLISQLYSDNRNIGLLSKEEKEVRKQLSNKIRNLTSELTESGDIKSDEERFRALRLKKYIDAKKVLNTEYFNYDESDGFKDTLEYYRNIVKGYERKHPLETLDQRLNNPSYREAYDWIQANTIYTLNKEAQEAVTKAFEVMKSKDNNNSNLIRAMLKEADAYDDYGNIDARKLTADHISNIRKLTEHKYSWTYDSNAGEAILIKEVPSGLPVLSNKFYQMLRSDSESKVNAERIRVIGEINKLLSKAVDRHTGQINSKDLFDKLTSEELDDLGNYYSSLHHIKGDRNNVEIAKKFKKNVDFLTNDAAFNREWGYAQNNLKGTKQYDTWLNIFVQKDKSGVYVTDDNGKFVPNNDIFGYILPKDKTYIDQDKTDARNTIENDIEYVPNEYYYAAQREASNEGKFNEWYNANHIFNPYTHRMEPLKVWTTMQINPNGKLDGSYTYAPTYENTERTVKDEYVNPNHKQYSTNYNIDSGEYNNLASLTKKERDMLELLQSTINAHASTHSMRMFAEQGYLPRRARYEPDLKWYAGQALGSMGLEFRNTGEQQWSDKIDYVSDFDTDFNMMSLIKQKGYKERIQINSKGTRESDEDYAKRVEDIRAQNKIIDAENLKLDNELLDNDWKSVFNDFIDKATEYNAKQRLKNTAYLLLEDLKDNPAFEESNWGRSLKRDGARSSIERDAYQTTSQNNTHDLVQNWIRRILFDQFKKTSPYSKYADLAQNITSAKYMIANVTGGIANIATGMTNVLGEVFASDYFGKESFAKGQAQYMSNTLSFIADMYKDTTNNPTVGISKLFDVVDFDAFTERRPNEKATERVKRVRDSLYALQSGGEHYMQNSVLFAILKSHRIFKDTDGQLRAGSISNFNWELEVQTLMGMLNGKEDLLIRYKSFLKDIKTDLNELRKYDTFTKDFNEEFLRDVGDKDLINEYITKRKEALAKSEEEFNKNPVVEDQFELVDGVTYIKEDSPMTGQMFAELKHKVIAVNKKIHGVYDKIGAASIEKEWWGGLVMQYHKHIYPGIMKRYRKKGYYNESRSSIEKGSYVSLADYLSKEFRGIGKRIKNRTETDNENVALASFQEIIKASIDTVINFKLNYQMMPIWEQNNMRRALGDLLGVGSAFMLALAIHMLTDDDEIKESESLATALYIADRLNSESQSYTPWGIVGDARKLWSSPIAAQNGPKDLIKGLGIATGMLFDAEYNPNYTTGLYKGENKLSVLLYRNTPAYRVYQRLGTMTKNNNYYKLNENALNIKFAKAIANELNPE